MGNASVESKNVTLLELLDRIIERGVVLTGDIVISVADVDLIALELRLILASAERMEQLRAGNELARREEGTNG